MKVFPQRQRGSLFVSIAVHAILIVTLATITYDYHLGQLLGVQREREAPAERLRYMVLPSGPAAPIGNGANPNAKPPKAAPAPLRAPTSVPTAVPEPTAPSQTEGAVSGKEGGKGGAPTGMATGVEPTMPDPRVPLSPGAMIVPEKTIVERVDSTIKAVFKAEFDSMAVADKNRGRDPTDWTVGRDGNKWGLDQKYIHLGKWKLPSAVLALLPLQPGGVDGNRILDNRNAAGIRRDVLEHAQMALTEDEFKTRVRRIRERKEREKQEQSKTVAGAPSGVTSGSSSTSSTTPR